MAEALGIVASVIAITQITGTVLSVCYDYSAAAKGTSWKLPELISELESLRSVLQRLEPLAKQAESTQGEPDTKLPAFNQLCKQGGPLDICSREIGRLEKLLKSPSWEDKFGPRRKALVQALRWPLREKDAESTLAVIGRLKEILSFALTADDTALLLEIERFSKQELQSVKGMTLHMQDTLDSTRNIASGIHNQLKEERLSGQKEKWLSWLRAPDPSTNYQRGRRSRHANTGTWFTKGKQFLQWKKRSNSILWLHGKAGCGKTVLSSTIITETVSQCSSSDPTGVAYFFFDFNDPDKQKSGQMIRSLLTQLSSRSIDALAELEPLFMSCLDGREQPDEEGLLRVLQAAIRHFKNIYIIIDALDECSHIEELLIVVREISGWCIPSLHLMLTSRWLTVIDETMRAFMQSESMSDLKSRMVDRDISAFVNEQLKTSPNMKRWSSRPDIQEEIRSTLTEKADGMFRWAVCQLEALRKCPNVLELRKALRSLPKTLDETYARMLCSIPEEQCKYAITMLRWLAYAFRPLELSEIGELVAVNVAGEPWFDPDARFPEPMDLLSICPGLVQIEENKLGRIVRLAHFSVKEYLTSEQIRTQEPNAFFMPEALSHDHIAADCLAYLLYVSDRETASTSIETFPFLEHATEMWHKHACSASSLLETAKPLIITFINSGNTQYEDWCLECLGTSTPVPPLHAMAHLGLSMLVRTLLQMNQSVNELCKHGTALRAASRKGHYDSVRILLEYGADPNLRGGKGVDGPPLEAAAYRGHSNVMSLLLDKGAWINYEFDTFGSALIAACLGQHYDAARLLLDRGITLHTTHYYYGTALHAACERSHAETSLVELLLSRGAGVNANGGFDGTALNAACKHGENDAVIRLLLSHGANPLLKCGIPRRNAIELYCESYRCNDEVVRELVESGVQKNPQMAAYRTVLEAACSKRYSVIVKMFFDEQTSFLENVPEGHALDINKQRETLGNAIWEACRLNDAEMVALLLQSGADPNLSSDSEGLPLYTAFRLRNPKIVELLLDGGADVNAKAEHDGVERTVLQVLISSLWWYSGFRACSEIVRLVYGHNPTETGLSPKETEQLAEMKREARIPDIRENAKESKPQLHPINKSTTQRTSLTHAQRTQSDTTLNKYVSQEEYPPPHHIVRRRSSQHQNPDSK